MDTSEINLKDSSPQQETDKRSLRENWGQTPPCAVPDKWSGARPKGRNFRRIKSSSRADSTGICKERITSKNDCAEGKITCEPVKRSVEKIKRKKNADRNYHRTFDKHEKAQTNATGEELQKQVYGRKRLKADGKKKRYDKKAKAKATFLYIVIGDDITKTSNTKGFLAHRMGNPTALAFELMDASDINVAKGKLKRNIIILKFESYKKASAARYLLHLSNRNVSSKVRCFFSLTEAEGQDEDMTRERKRKLMTTCRDIDELTAKALSKHDEIIEDVQEKFSRVDQIRKKGVNFYEFEKIENEWTAYKDKLIELKKQKAEFIGCITCMKENLEKVITHDKFEQELTTIRKEFGVECRRLAVALPIYARREDILRAVRDNQVCIILGETGSGKSTQMVQYLYQAGFGGMFCTKHICFHHKNAHFLLNKTLN